MTKNPIFVSAMLVALALSHAVYAQNSKKLNGFWSGKYTCSENISIGARSKDAFSTRIIFSVDGETGTAKLQNKQTVDKYELNVGNPSSVTIEGKGNWINDPERKWSTHATGSIDGNKLQATGSMYSGDGTLIRKRCTFLLTNEEMGFAPSTQKPSKPTTASASPPKTISTPAPAAVAATSTAPARTAAIGNVSPVPVTPQTAQTKKVTTNPLDAQKKTHPNDVWINFNPAITVQERQFCRLVENFRTEYAVAETTRNQIKMNESLRGLSQSLNALLPDGKFQGWVMRTASISQAADGSAEVLLELPCATYVGSNTCDADPKNFYGTAAEGSRIYTELAKMTVGDFALVSGQFVYADDKVFSKDRSVASFKYMKTGAHCKAKSIAANADFFGLKLDVLSTIK